MATVAVPADAIGRFDVGFEDGKLIELPHQRVDWVRLAALCSDCEQMLDGSAPATFLRDGLRAWINDGCFLGYDYEIEPMLGIPVTRPRRLLLTTIVTGVVCVPCKVAQSSAGGGVGLD